MNRFSQRDDVTVTLINRLACTQGAALAYELARTWGRRRVDNWRQLNPRLRQQRVADRTVLTDHPSGSGGP